MRSASLEERRGGDVFEVFMRQDGSTSILLADISSKGDVALRHSHMLRSAFIRTANDQRQPTRILSRLNGLVFNTPATEANVTFATAFVATFSGEAMSMTYASGGHDLAMIMGRRSHRHLGVTGPLLGVFAEPAFTERHEPFGAADLLVLVTDGVTECRHPREKALQFGTTGIVRAFSSADFDGSHSACDALADRFDTFSGHRYRDDATIAIVGRR